MESLVKTSICVFNLSNSRQYSQKKIKYESTVFSLINSKRQFLKLKLIFFLVFNSNSPQSYKKRKKRTSKSCSHYSQKLQSSKYHHITNVKFVNNDVKEIGNQTTVTLRPQLNELVVVTRRFSVAKSVV